MLVVVRHGRTSWNAEGRFQGWADVPLDEEGRRQSQRAGERIAGLLREVGVGEVGGGVVGEVGVGVVGVPGVAVVSSDLQRAAGTAARIAAALGVAATTDPLLREVDVGRWEGLTREEARSRYPQEYRRWAAGEQVRRGGGETSSEAGERVAGAITAWLDAAPGHLVVVGHGMSLRAALDRLAADGTIELAGPAPHLGNAEHLVLQDCRHDPDERLLSQR